VNEAPWRDLDFHVVVHLLLIRDTRGHVNRCLDNSNEDNKSFSNIALDPKDSLAGYHHSVGMKS